VLLRVLVGAGFGRPPREPEYDLSRFNDDGAAAAAATRPAMTPQDMARLSELEASLQAQLAAGAAQAEAETSAPAPSPRPLPATALDPSETPAEAPSKEYGGDAGDYYPTEIHGQRKQP
jgi:hypothetical protein